MMTRKTLLLMTVAAGFAASAAMADDTGPYVGLGAGLHIPDSSQINTQVPLGNPFPANKTTFDTGFGIVGAAGYKWSTGFRSELEAGYRSAGMGNITVTGIGALAPLNLTGHQKVMSLMGNLLFDVGIGTSFQPYVGGGAGIAWNKWSNVAGFVTPTNAPVFNDRDAKFQWQAIVGVTFPINDQLGAFVDYRYIGANKFRFNSSPPGSVVTNHDDSSHNFFVGIRYSFGSKPMKERAAAAAAPPPPAPPPAPPAPPPAPPVPQKFLVFFDFDRSALRADASKIVAEAADYAKKNGKAVIRATGHADTSGSPSYNLALSERRANAVKAELVRMGFNDREVVVLFKGESEPLVATGDGVKEPQNRRVEIVME